MLAMRKIREKQGLSLVGLCMLTGIDPGNLSRIERGYLYAYAGWRRRISEALAVPEAELFCSDASNGSDGGDIHEVT